MLTLGKIFYFIFKKMYTFYPKKSIYYFELEFKVNLNIEMERELCYYLD